MKGWVLTTMLVGVCFKGAQKSLRATRGGYSKGKYGVKKDMIVYTEYKVDKRWLQYFQQQMLPGKMPKDGAIIFW